MKSNTLAIKLLLICILLNSFTIITVISLNGTSTTQVNSSTDSTQPSLNILSIDSNSDIIEGERFVMGTGTAFKITNSEYLDIILTSSEPIDLYLDSVPRFISFNIESNNGAPSTLLTISGLEPDKTYYMYQDSLLVNDLTTDSSGQYIYIQDISQPHSIRIQEEPSTLVITSDFTFTNNIYDSIFVMGDNIVVDGNGYSVQGSGYGIGMEIYGSNNIIKNVVVAGWSYGIHMNGWSGQPFMNNNISGNIIQNSHYGFNFQNIKNQMITGNVIQNNKDGIYFIQCHENTISENTITRNEWSGISIWSSAGNIFNMNVICENYQNGISINGGSENVIYENNIKNNVIYGIDLRGSPNSLIYHNNIINNWVRDNSPGVTDWHHPTLLEGNYWSSYQGVDDGSGTGKHSIAGDGIGDTQLPAPYQAAGYDFYPFIDENGWVQKDTEPPNTTIYLEGELGLEEWYISDVEITLTAEDEFSEIDYIAYSFNEIDWITYEEPFIISDEGITAIYYYSTDVVGNIEPTKSETLKIDKTSPITQLYIDPHYIDDEGNIYVISETEFTFSAYDAFSGVENTYYRINDGDWTEYIDAFNLTGPPGNYIIDYYSVDVAGNEETLKSVIVILEENFQGFGVLRTDSKLVIGKANLYISENLIRIEINNYIETWDVIKHCGKRKIDFYYAKGDLGRLVLIIHREKPLIVGAGRGVLFLSLPHKSPCSC